MSSAEQQYRDEWATKTGRADSDIYIPEALREEPIVAEENPSAKFELSFDDDVVTVELEFKFSDNAEDFLDIGAFVNIASHQLLRSMTGE